jgi:hypothetical protein
LLSQTVPKRSARLGSDPNEEWVSTTSYNAAGQMTNQDGQMGYRNWSYNLLGQLTRQSKYQSERYVKPIL